MPLLVLPRQEGAALLGIRASYDHVRVSERLLQPPTMRPGWSASTAAVLAPAQLVQGCNLAASLVITNASCMMGAAAANSQLCTASLEWPLKMGIQRPFPWGNGCPTWASDTWWLAAQLLAFAGATAYCGILSCY